MNFSQLLTDKSDEIIQAWMQEVTADDQITSTAQLTHKAILNSLPLVLQAMATMLAQGEDGDIQKLIDASLEHGTVRAAQGYEPAEIAREYRLLRWVIFSILEANLVESTPTEMLRAVRLIDTVIDEAIARCFKSYTEGRLKELEQLQGQLKLNNQELTRLVDASKINLSHLAHELKTPLTSIIGYSDLFLRQQKQVAEIKDSVPNLESIERVLNSGRQLLRLINDALEISRYEAGEMKLDLTPTDVRSLIQHVVEMLYPLAKSKELQISFECDQAPQKVITDAFRLEQIVSNLLSNAIRYTESGRVQLKCQCLDQQYWSLSVTDTGLGIDAEDQKQIFEPYFRGLPPDKATLAYSTGLGLAIVARLVKLLQGQIELVSQLGSGSSFTVTLPLEVKHST